jgi:hypothetical protein
MGASKTKSGSKAKTTVKSLKPKTDKKVSAAKVKGGLTRF